MKLKIVTLNIWRGEIYKEAIKFLMQENADIIFLQEVYDGKDKNLPIPYRLYSFLSEMFPRHFSVFGAQFCDITEYGNIEEGNAIFSRFPIISSKNTFFDVPYSVFNNRLKERFDDNPQAILQAKLKFGEGILNTFCVHGVWGFDGKDNERRFTMAKVIKKETAGVNNTIMAGDFNLVHNTQAVGQIEENLTSVFRNELVSTFNMKYKDNGGYATAAVDMVFVSSNISVLSKNCPQVDVSDHLPLVATLEL
ncbi:MAG: endonuclease/exonuclease/phosphatase family protein [Candidatus Levybacteria bacterium]|nr:endonuclease/exonuclease/phosphatase family protein [Candidatus Levybacteria bacterium]MBP9814992.1 endonuclease/exonuclease/phosphatase family protein [Candidatus Levybacteria bacterium]